MSRIGVGSQRVVQFGAASSQDDQPSPGFEELAMPLFDPPVQLRALAGAQRQRCPGPSTRDLSQGLRQFCVVSARHQFPGLDVQDPQEHLSKFMLNT